MLVRDCDWIVNKIKFIINSILIVLFLFVGIANADTSILSIARSQIGNGEIGGNNKGEFVKLYNRGLEASWCAGFVSWVMNSAGKDFNYNLSAKKIYNEGNKVSTPQPGDIICFWRKNPKSWMGHVGIVENVTDDYIYTIEGNKGSFPAKVSRYQYKRNDIPKLLGYVRV